MWGHARIQLLGLVHTEPRLLWFGGKKGRAEQCRWDAILYVPRGKKSSMITIKCFGGMAEKLSAFGVKKGDPISVTGELDYYSKSGRGWSHQCRITDFTILRRKAQIADRLRGKVLLAEDEYRRLKALTKDMDDWEIPPDVLETIEIPKTPSEEDLEAEDLGEALGYSSVSLLDLMREEPDE